jgi:putative glutamine amidotransferase
MTQPVIGITAWKRYLSPALDDAEVLHALADPYVQAIRRAGGVPIILPTTDASEAAVVLDVVDGLVLSGGGDMAPASYGHIEGDRIQDVNSEADSFEMALVRLAEARDLPVLGICRGAQVLNVAFGGTLHQDISVEGSESHPLTTGWSGPRVIAARHRVLLESGSTLAGIYGTTERTVNSIHHQSIDAVADGFRIVATAPDGVVEAIEASGSWLALGVQWHPERLEAAEEQPLFAAFVDGVRTRLVEPGGIRFA